MPNENPSYGFEEATRFSKEYEDLVPVSSVEPLKQIIDAYKQHMSRVLDLGELPAVLVFFSVLFTEIQIEAREHAKQLRLKPPLDGPVISAYQQKEFEKWLASGTEDELLVKMRRNGMKDLNSFISKSDAKVRPGIEATLASMLSDSWSAFEILAGDLWIETINACPRTVREQFKTRTVTLKELSDFKYDVSDQMGSFLVATKKVGFHSLDGIKEAYAVFDREGAKPGRELIEQSALIDAVGEIRNCLAHRGGVVDQKALRHVKRIPGLEACKIGERIPLTGPVVRDCINLTVECSVRLFRFADEWVRDQASERGDLTAGS